MMCILSRSWKERKAIAASQSVRGGVRWANRRLHEETAVARLLRFSSTSVRIDWIERRRGASERKSNLRTVRMASSKTVLSPFWVKAEHSKYYRQSTNLVISGTHLGRLDVVRHARSLSSIECSSSGHTWEYPIGACRLSRSFSNCMWSSRKSSLVPTRMMGVPGATDEYWYKTRRWEHTVVLDLRPPLPVSFQIIIDKAYLRTDVLERGRGDDRETQQKDIGLRITQRSQSAAVSLTRGCRECRHLSPHGTTKAG